MPGPVEIADPIREAFHQPPISHRSPEFIQRFEGVRERLCALAGSPLVALFQGSGTLANEVIASQLEGPGLVLVNGEFGSRLATQAQAWSLPVRTLEWPWGTPWDIDQAARAMDGARWVWGVHLETSTGLLNDIGLLSDRARERNVRVCLDCVSSLGAAPLDLDGVWLASGVSGKALGAYAGVAMVFAQELPRKRPVPAYLDLLATLQSEGSRFTFASPLLFALDAALGVERNYAPVGSLVRRKLRERGMAPMATDDLAAPTVTTFATPAPRFAERCQSLGYWVGGESGYLARRGLTQIANMGAIFPEHIEDLFDRLA
jgi:aspartate aminotransferase-like enzyme